MHRTGGRAVLTFWIAGSRGRPIVPDEVGHWVVIETVDTESGYWEAWRIAASMGAGRYAMVTRVELVDAEL